ncbi:hypothetical protein ACFVR1_06265 [Psychrobacillus sp. NPDC058041]|uniref:hypothetical protein n=1 Tax=Psychrobacillus sp. NPDC058041 TaxID=3346310 RepID=UPI0036DA0DA3
MKISYKISVILIGVASTIVMLGFNLPILIIYPSILLLFLLILFLPQFYTVYKSNNLKRIERFLEENKRKPIFAYVLAIKTGDTEKIIEAIQAILHKHKNRYLQEVYKTNLAYYENNVSKIEQLAKQISKEPLRTYNIAYVEVLKGNFEDARRLKENLPTGWMPYAIEAIIANEQGDIEAFQNEAKNSIEHARGIQKFSLLYSFEHMERNIK